MKHAIQKQSTGEGAEMEFEIRRRRKGGGMENQNLTTGNRFSSVIAAFLVVNCHPQRIQAPKS